MRDEAGTTRAAVAAAAFSALLAVSFGSASAAVSVEADQPRAFGYSVGDVVRRHVTVHASGGLTLDEASLPPVGRHGKALELRALDRRVVAEAGGQRHEITLDYQVFLSPTVVRTLEMPPITLHFRAGSGSGRGEDARIDARPLTVSPLVPVEVSPRRGLGELQPDAAPPPIDTALLQRRLAASAAVLALLLGGLFAVYIALPWFGRHRRPFERAWRALRRQPAPGSAEGLRGALRQVHAALNQTAGQVLFAGGVDRFVAARPAFAPLRDELAIFFGHSQRAFFAAAGDVDTQTTALGPWLLAFCRRCRNAERGLA